VLRNGVGAIEHVEQYASYRINQAHTIWKDAADITVDEKDYLLCCKSIKVLGRRAISLRQQSSLVPLVVFLSTTLCSCVSHRVRTQREDQKYDFFRKEGCMDQETIFDCFNLFEAQFVAN
jgi:hypothetical protein